AEGSASRRPFYRRSRPTSGLVRRLLPHREVLVADEAAGLVKPQAQELRPRRLQVLAGVERGVLVEGRRAVVGREEAAARQLVELARRQSRTRERGVRAERARDEDAPGPQDPAGLLQPR